ncbi:MAG: hypothetical protein A2847_00915 [Candidatus Sungbacteria bacterium RIFCSPHIGHO2_01_FULL_50_25]|uniref:Uncharacterized protein n=1 Tax=Candidatus Sungbacteria bacterium RIFCSPHIGHO2_01_FULL_50_25 TaxID=1802265 RepID=A0A1G2KBN1_9BACT|nr:MAG: hypothetical protein A2847_00915 [Candidatus Sungbacteria bacterium RIFCSPHIGHO2_01_FULL_50_25]
MIPVKSAHGKEITMQHGKETVTRIEEILAESRDKREAMLRIQRRINAILGTVQIDCGINDKRQFLILIECIVSDLEITTKLNTFIRSGFRIWVNYGELMDGQCQIDQDGSLMIAHNATIGGIRTYLGISSL